MADSNANVPKNSKPHISISFNVTRPCCDVQVLIIFSLPAAGKPVTRRPVTRRGLPSGRSANRIGPKSTRTRRRRRPSDWRPSSRSHWPPLTQFFPTQFHSIENSIQVGCSDAPGASAEETRTPVLLFPKKI